MEIEAETLDDVLATLYPELLDRGDGNAASRGTTNEKVGVLLRITKPRARLSRSFSRGKPFSALGELLWYLARSDKLDFIKRYISRYEDESDDGVSVHGAYGPRLFAMRDGINQIENVIRLLQKRGTSRRAVIQLFNAEDIDGEFKEIPCTTTLQFFLREGRLHLIVTLRSNDAFKGLPHDVFCFTMLQEMIAVRLAAELGEYRQFVGSMHMYSDDFDDARKYLDEGFQRAVEMPVMPAIDPFGLIPTLLRAERKIRAGDVVIASETFGEPYWADVVRLLQVFDATGDKERLLVLKSEFSSPIYRSYLEGRMDMKPRKPDVQKQPDWGF